MSDLNRHLMALSAKIVSAHASHNQMEIPALAGMIRSVFDTLSNLGPFPSGPAITEDGPNFDQKPGHHDGHSHPPHPAPGGYMHPEHGQTVFSDHLVCMEDGLSMKMLKRHLLTVHGMTPDEYRAKWGLPESYPMVASDYAKLRSNLALQSGLGLKPDDRRSGRARRGS